MATASSANVTAWGEESLTLAFASFNYELQGLSSAHKSAIAERFQLQGQPPQSRMTVPVTCAFLDFHDEDTDRFGHPVSGYTPLVVPTAEGYWLEGYEFRGSIRLAPPVSGVLYACKSEWLPRPMVLENYLRLLTAHVALTMGGLLMHSAGVVIDGRAVLFLGRSGAGKSTIAKMALEAGHDILSDDNNVLLPSLVGGFEAGRVPFAGDLGQVPCREVSAFPVAGIFWLDKADTTAVCRVTAGVAGSRIIACCPTVNASDECLDALFATVNTVVQQVPLLTLSFNKRDHFSVVANCIRQALSLPCEAAVVAD